MIQQIETQLGLNFISKNLIPITEVKDLGVFLDSFLSYVSKLGQINMVKHLFDQKRASLWL